MDMVFDLVNEAQGLQVGDDGAPGLVAVHALVFPAVFVDFRVVVQYQDRLRLCRRPISKSLGSWLGVILTQPSRKDISTYSSATTGISRFTRGRITVFPTRC